MHATVTIHVDLDDPEVISDIIRALETIIPYMGDNVIVTSNNDNELFGPFTAIDEIEPLSEDI